MAKLCGLWEFWKVGFYLQINNNKIINFEEDKFILSSLDFTARIVGTVR